MTQIQEDHKPSFPIEVAIDQPIKSEDAQHKVDVLLPSRSKFPFQAFLSEPNYLGQWLEKERSLHVQMFFLEDLYKDDKPFFYVAGQSNESIDDNFINFSSSVQKKIFPVKIKYEPPLNELIVIDDGSKLFRSEKFATSPALLLRPYETTLTYDVIVASKKGKIASFTRKKELLDKNLLRLSDAIIKKIRFVKNNDSNISGGVTITFLCHSDDIKKLLKEPFRYYQE